MNSTLYNISDLIVNVAFFRGGCYKMSIFIHTKITLQLTILKAGWEKNPGTWEPDSQPTWHFAEGFWDLAERFWDLAERFWDLAE